MFYYLIETGSAKFGGSKKKPGEVPATRPTASADD
jgi:multidrug efflux pump